MKKLLIAALIAVLGLAFTVPVSALENEFGGYWRVRMWTAEFSGDDSDDYDESLDFRQADTRTRLYYTAKINDNLKLVNKFEMDAVWGEDKAGYGDIGADGVKLEIKNTYADFNLGAANFKVGTQGVVIARGFFMDDDFSGVIANFPAGAMNNTFVYAKVDEAGPNADDDVALWGYLPSFNLGAAVLNPYVLYADQADDDNAYWVGADLDINLNPISFWATAIYNGGETGDVDIKAFLGAVGGTVDMGMFDIHGQAFYASGDDDGEDYEAFSGVGASYYWSEIMGYGIFDWEVSANAPADKISDITAYNLGAKIKPMDKLSLTLDLWHATLNEKRDGDPLGTEIDGKLTYELVDGLNLDLVAAYLFIDDGTYDGADDEDCYELGTRLSLSF